MKEQEYWEKGESRWQHGDHVPSHKRGLDYFTRAPLDQLEEWNEGHIFEGRNATVSMGDLGVMVTMEFRHLVPHFDKDTGELTHLGAGDHWSQLCAVFGDDDDLKRLVIFHDEPTAMHQPKTVEYIDAPIRR